jgi:hypothetical protein
MPRQEFVSFVQFVVERSNVENVLATTVFLADTAGFNH